MKKYFMKGTEDELQFGDMIELDLTKDMPNGKVTHHHFECKFIPELISLLLDEEVIEEVDVEVEPTDEEETDICPMVDELVKANENLEHRVYNLEETMIDLSKTIQLLTEAITSKKASHANKAKGK